MDFIPSQTPVPIPAEAAGNESTVPFLIVLGLAALVSAVIFAWRNWDRTRPR